MIRTHKEALEKALSDPVVYAEYDRFKANIEITRRRRLRKAYRDTRKEDKEINEEWDAATMDKWPEGPAI